MRMFFDRKPLASLDEALNYYKPKEFESPTRSTVPLVSLLKYAGEFWSHVAGELAGGYCEAHLEYQVKPPSGRGTSSHTDLMVVGGSHSIAIEAKWTEPPYDKVGDWMNQGSGPPNRREVMSGWLSLLQRHTAKRLYVDAFSNAIYQMVHRAASACAIGHPALAYIQFSPLPDGKQTDLQRLKADLTNLHGLLGAPAGFPFLLIEVEAKATSAFEHIEGLPKGSANTAEEVKIALRNGPLFDFTGFHIDRIQGTA